MFRRLLVPLLAILLVAIGAAPAGADQISIARGKTGQIVDFPYPNFPSTTIAKFQSASDVQSSGAGTVTDVTTPDSPYGVTAPQITFNGGTSSTIPKVFQSTPINVSGGSIRIAFKPISGIYSAGSPTTMEVRLYSSGSPTSLPTSYLGGAFSASFVRSNSTSINSSTPGRYQTLAVPVQAFTTVGTPDPTQIIGAAYFWRGSNGTIMDIGNIDFVPNPRAKAAVILRGDDGYSDAINIALPLLQPVGAPMFLAVGNALSHINGNGWLTWSQIQTLVQNGWQYGGQSYFTEDSTIVNAWSATQRNIEYALTRNFGRNVNQYRGTFDSTYYSNVGPNDMIAYPQLAANFRTLFNFKNANANQNPPWYYSETFPYGDPHNVLCLNINSFGNGQASGAGSTISQYLQFALDQTRLAKGVLCVAMHNDLSVCPNCLTAFQDMITYVTQTWPNQIEFTTPRKIIAPYNGDNLQNFLLKRDLDPASNDNDPVWLDKAA